MKNKFGVYTSKQSARIVHWHDNAEMLRTHVTNTLFLAPPRRPGLADIRRLHTLLLFSDDRLCWFWSLIRSFPTFIYPKTSSLVILLQRSASRLDRVATRKQDQTETRLRQTGHIGGGLIFSSADTLTASEREFQHEAFSSLSDTRLSRSSSDPAL